MERAGTAVARVVLARFPGRVAVVCGGGNNGGDGRVCARVLREAGRDVTVVEGLGDLGEPDVVVDALLGIGLKEAPREDAARMIERINASGKPVVAIDVPSGVDASTGEVPGAAVRATVDRHVRAPRRSGSRSRPGASTPARCRSLPIGLAHAGARARARARDRARARCRARAARARSTAPAACSSSAARAG